jgi:hypothetical protein
VLREDEIYGGYKVLSRVQLMSDQYILVHVIDFWEAYTRVLGGVYASFGRRISTCAPARYWMRFLIVGEISLAEKYVYFEITTLKYIGDA